MKQKIHKCNEGQSKVVLWIRPSTMVGNFFLGSYPSNIVARRIKKMTNPKTQKLKRVKDNIIKQETSRFNITRSKIFGGGDDKSMEENNP